VTVSTGVDPALAFSSIRAPARIPVSKLGIVRGSNLPQGGTEITFQTLPAPACAP